MQFYQLPSVALSYFPESHWCSEISSLSKVILVLGKDRNLLAPNLVWAWVTGVIWCFTKNILCMRCDACVGVMLWWSCQSPVAHSYGFLKDPNRFRTGMLKFDAKFDADPLLYSLSHCLLPLLTSTVKSSLFTHLHTSPFSLAPRLHQCHTNCSLYFNNGWTFSRPTLYTSLQLNIYLI